MLVINGFSLSILSRRGSVSSHVYIRRYVCVLITMHDLPIFIPERECFKSCVRMCVDNHDFTLIFILERECVLITMTSPYH